MMTRISQSEAVRPEGQNFVFSEASWFLQDKRMF